MSEYLLEAVQIENPVLDMGTGTGVLAILAEKRGATEIVAVDIEPWSVENTIENAERNNCKNIIGLCGDLDVVPEKKFGLILANINKNILKAHLPGYAKLAKQGAQLYLSGFFVSDAPEMIEAAEHAGFRHVKTKELETWAALQFERL
jgi:ribosomal protein L11 methyltransferase